MIKLGDSNGKYNNREYNCTHCFNINGILWYAKTKEKILYFQTVQIGMSVISNIILGGITGAIINALSMIRNILCYKNKLGLKEKIIITILAIILTFKFNNLEYIGLLPLISTVSYIWLMNTKDVRKFKLLIIFTMLMWLIYDVVIKSYTSAIFDFMNIIANMLTLLQIKLVKN